jgi:hypothetical protein
MRRLQVGAARVLVADLRGEEFEKARLCTRVRGGDKSGSAINNEEREGFHEFAPNGTVLICFLLTQ